MCEPLFRIDCDETITFTAGIVFVNHGTPPFNHLLLDRNRAWSRSMNSALQAGNVVFQSHIIIQF